MFDLWSFLHQTAAASMAALFVLVLQHIFRDKLVPPVAVRGLDGGGAPADPAGGLAGPLCHSRPDRAGRGPADLGSSWGLDSAWSCPLDPPPCPLAGIPSPRRADCPALSLTGCPPLSGGGPPVRPVAGGGRAAAAPLPGGGRAGGRSPAGGRRRPGGALRSVHAPAGGGEPRSLLTPSVVGLVRPVLVASPWAGPRTAR